MELIAQSRVATGVQKNKKVKSGGKGGSKRIKSNLLKKKRKEQGEGKAHTAGRQERKKSIIRMLTQIVRKA